VRLAILATRPSNSPVEREFPEPRIVVDNLDFLAAKDALLGSLGSLGRVPLLKVDEDALELGAVLSSLGNHVNVVNLAEADVANNKSDTLFSDVGKDARNTKAG
jgi:hypothetical protein